MALEVPVWVQRGDFPSHLDRLLVDTLFDVGVLDAQTAPAVNPPPASFDLRVVPNASRLAVDVAPGVAVIAGSDQTRQGKYVCRSTAVETVDLDPRPSTGLTRRDLVFARVRDSSSGIDIPPGSDGWVVDKVTGVPSGSSPQVPATPTSAIALAYAVVAAGADVTLAPGDVVDLRRRARMRAPAQGWHPTKFAYPGGAASIVGLTGLGTFAIGPYPCKWVADISYNCTGSGTGQITAFVFRNDGDPPAGWTRLAETRIQPAASFASGSCRAVYQQDDGAYVLFGMAGDVAGGTTADIVGGAPLHVVDILVHLCP